MDKETKVQIEVTREELDEIVQGLHLSAQDDERHLPEYGLTMKDVKRVKDLAKAIGAGERTRVEVIRKHVIEEVWEYLGGEAEQEIGKLVPLEDMIFDLTEHEDNGIEDLSRDAITLNP